MPRKVILHGDALKLLYTFLDYAQADNGQLADALCYDHSAFKQRAQMLQSQVNAGRSIEWDDLETELENQ